MQGQRVLHNSPKKLSILITISLLALTLSGCAAKPGGDQINFSKWFAKKQSPSETAAFSPLKTIGHDIEITPTSADADNILRKNLFETASVAKGKYCAPGVLAFRETGGSYDKLLKTAFTQLGKYYRTGGTDPGTGFDCSGFTSWVFAANGINLPRSSREQFLEGKIIGDRTQLQRGDLVFFRKKKSISHVGIYLENGQFIHSSRRGDTVKISSLSEPVWDRQYAGGRRYTNN